MNAVQAFSPAAATQTRCPGAQSPHCLQHSLILSSPLQQPTAQIEGTLLQGKMMLSQHSKAASVLDSHSPQGTVGTAASGSRSFAYTQPGACSRETVYLFGAGGQPPCGAFPRVQSHLLCAPPCGGWSRPPAVLRASPGGQAVWQSAYGPMQWRPALFWAGCARPAPAGSQRRPQDHLQRQQGRCGVLTLSRAWEASAVSGP